MSSRITLKPLDDGQKAVEIPVGKTTIGRGPFLGCSDKKVSRNHAVLEVTNKGEVYLTPTHVNPCFYQPTADSPGQILKKDIPHKLENGDSFSLLPRAFRYQLVVTGENPEDKTDQNDLNKQSGKTNGAAAECEEALLNERNKETKSGKGIPNEELADGNTVTEKPFSKEDEILANIDKSYSKDENTFAKKIPDISEDSKPSCPKEDKEINEDKESEKEKSANSSSKNEVCNEEKKSQSSEGEKDEVDKAERVNDHTKNSESCTDVKTEEEKSKFSEKIVEEESTLGNDSFPKDKTEAEHAQSDDKSDSKSVPDKTDKKSEDLAANNEDDNLDQVRALMTTGLDTENVLIPKFYYINHIILPQNLDTTQNSRTVSSILDDMPFKEETSNVADDDKKGQSHQHSSSSRSSITLKRALPKVGELLEKIAKHMEQPLVEKRKEKHDAYGEHVAEKLRSLPTAMVPFCQKLINEAIFMAEQQSLNVSSRIMTDPPVPPSTITATQDLEMTACCGAGDSDKNEDEYEKRMNFWRF